MKNGSLLLKRSHLKIMDEVSEFLHIKSVKIFIPVRFEFSGFFPFKKPEIPNTISISVYLLIVKKNKMGVYKYQLRRTEEEKTVLENFLYGILLANIIFK